MIMEVVHLDPLQLFFSLYFNVVDVVTRDYFADPTGIIIISYMNLLINNNKWINTGY